MLKLVNQTIVFILELIMIGWFAFFGFRLGNTTLTKYAFAVIVPVVATLLWGYWAAPKSANRLKMPYLALFRLSMFLLTSYFLYVGGQTSFAIVLAVISVITQVGSYFIENDP